MGNIVVHMQKNVIERSPITSHFANFFRVSLLSSPCRSNVKRRVLVSEHEDENLHLLHDNSKIEKYIDNVTASKSQKTVQPANSSRDNNLQQNNIKHRETATRIKDTVRERPQESWKIKRKIGERGKRNEKRGRGKG